MRYIFYISLLLFGSTILSAQDTLYKTDGSHQIVKIKEVNDDLVKYIPSSIPDGPVYSILKSYVTKIVYESGLIDSFPGSKIDTQRVKHPCLHVKVHLLFHQFGLQERDRIVERQIPG